MTVLEAAEHARRRHAQQRADAPGPDPRRVLGGAPARARHAVLAALRPRGARADVALAGGPVRAPARRRRAAPRRSGRSSRRRPRSASDGERLALAVRAAGRALRRHHRRLHAPDAARARPPAADGPLRPLLGAAGRAAAHALRRTARPRRCSPASPRTRSGRSRRRCRRRSASRSGRRRTPTAGRSPRAARRRSAAR